MRAPFSAGLGAALVGGLVLVAACGSTAATAAPVAPPPALDWVFVGDRPPGYSGPGVFTACTAWGDRLYATSTGAGGVSITVIPAADIPCRADRPGAR